MAYEHHTITAITDVPALVGTFAASLGFETDLSTPTQPIIRNPQGFGSNSTSNSLLFTDDAIMWRVSASVASVFHQLVVQSYEPDANSNSLVNNAILSYADFVMPIIGNPGVAQVPTDLHLIGSLSPRPYIAIVVQSGAYYRHMYIGNMEKIGNYEGGEVISATDGPQGSASSSIGFKDYSSMKYLFQGRSGRKTGNLNTGGVHVQHAELAAEWIQFRGTSDLTPHAAMPDEVCLGGYGDSINDGYLARARSPFSGQNILVPINLYVSESIVGDTIYHPIGRPAGVRLVNMQDIAPEQEIIVGGKLYRCFPSHSRRSESTMTRTGSGSTYRDYETSLWVGYAYAVDVEDSNSLGA